jgi:hypothetical protein
MPLTVLGADKGKTNIDSLSGSQSRSPQSVQNTSPVNTAPYNCGRQTFKVLKAF